MTVPLRSRSQTRSAPRSPHRCSVGSALGWLGHGCPHRCSTPIEDLSASIRFLRHGPTLAPTPGGTVVLIDGAHSDERVRAVIRTVTACTGTDGIQVRLRRGDATELAGASGVGEPEPTVGREPTNSSVGLTSPADQPAIGGAGARGGAPHRWGVRVCGAARTPHGETPAT